MKKETEAIRKQTERTQYREHSSPIFLTSSFVFNSAEHAKAIFDEEVEGHSYSRFGNPNTEEFIEKLKYLEGCEDGFAFATGMSAVFSGIAALLNSGDHIVASRSLFGATHSLFTKIFPKWNISCSYVDIDKPETWENAINPNTKMLYLESPSNPGLEIADLTYAGKLAKKHNLIFNIDNCFATPVIQTPADYGADLVTHSATKFIDGQGRVLGGAVVGRKDLINQIRIFARTTGPSLSPFNAWILSKSIETLSLRMERHCFNALEIAKELKKNSEINFVRYPFLPSHPQFELAKKQMKMGGGLVSFEVKGGVERAMKFINNLKMLSVTSNLGDSRTTITHPATTTHSKLAEQERLDVKITQGMVRMSVGLENYEDILEDIFQALEKSK
ncbi:MAG: aminotransferase class I/II-fold pyridoxal phosphate-dependent enzyme [Ignavibacteria bacterium]|mgnify:CR=1 FL=1|nr:aminotransferase class I/II-fold pyridoxal phosphate-dependent enzyme [Ignavibacteria bacterium]